MASLFTRRGRYTYTVMSGKSNFLYVHNGEIKLAVLFTPL